MLKRIHIFPTRKSAKIKHEYNILGSSSPRGISLVGETLYIAAMHLFKKENGKVEKLT